MKKRFLFLALSAAVILPLLFSSGVSASADEPFMTGEISVLGGMLNGHMTEFVYSSGSTISRLDWDLRRLFYTGFDVSGLIRKHYVFETRVIFGLSDDSGYMQDHDWNLAGVKTNYSKHTNTNDKLFEGKFAAGYLVDVAETVNLSFMGGVYLFDAKTTARNGYLEYPPGSARVDMYGSGVIYRQEYLIPRIGLKLTETAYGVGIDMWGYFGFMGMCDAVDNHVKRDLDFYDEIYYVFSYEVGLAVRYRITERISVKGSLCYQTIPEVSGKVRSVDTSTGVSSPWYKNAAGIELSYFSVNLGLSTLF